MKIIYSYKLLLLILTCYFLGQCKPINHCEANVPGWRNEAPNILNEFQLVEEEIQQNKELLNNNNRNKSHLFIRTDFYKEFGSENLLKLPKLKEWFSSKDWGFISYKGETKLISYRTCDYGQISYHGQLYFSKSGIRPSFTKNLVAEIADSLDLENGWYYILTKCDGCGN